MTQGMPQSTVAPADNRVFVLVLQHPQERREALSTARLITTNLRHAKIAVGLSWPSLSRLVGEAAEPRRWAVLHLGSARPPSAERRGVMVVDRHNEPVVDASAIL